VTLRDARHLGLVPDPLSRALVGVCLVALVALGCSERRPCPVGASGEPGAPSPRVPLVIANGPLVYYPAWLDDPQHAANRAAMLDEIRDVVPEADPRIPPSARGVPAGVTVVVLDPGPYAAPYSPTRLASGEWRPPSTVYVAWRGSSSGPRLPALPHELRHCLTRDPNAGHAP
jgi:hypothetical protein